MNLTSLDTSLLANIVYLAQEPALGLTCKKLYATQKVLLSCLWNHLNTLPAIAPLLTKEILLKPTAADKYKQLYLRIFSLAKALGCDKKTFKTLQRGPYDLLGPAQFIKDENFRVLSLTISRFMPKSYTRRLKMIHRAAASRSEQIQATKELLVSNVREHFRLLSSTFFKLKLSDKHLAILPDELSLLSHLKKLTLNRNALTHIPALNAFKLLEELKASHNALSVLSPSIGALHKLVKLKLKGNHLTTLPSSFGELKSLEYLDISENELELLPDTFGKLTKLKTLHLQNNKLTSLPACFTQLTHVKIINLASNHLTQLPSMEPFIHLYSLNLTKNQLKTLPLSLGFLAGLKYLYLTKNPLKSCPFSFYLLIKQLKEWEIDQPYFIELPPPS